MMLASFVGPVGAIGRTVGTQTILNRISGYMGHIVLEGYYSKNCPFFFFKV